MSSHFCDLPVALSGGLIASYSSETDAQYGAYLNRATSRTRQESMGAWYATTRGRSASCPSVGVRVWQRT